MLLFAIQLDEEKINREGIINLEGAYKSIDLTFAQKDVTLYKIEDGIHYYTRDIDKHDFEYLWMVNFALEKSDWFKDNVKIWRYIDEEDGFIFEEEDLLEDD